MEHFISVESLTKSEIYSLIYELNDICHSDSSIAQYYCDNATLLRSKLMATLFLSKSLRTRASFISSFLRLGGSHLCFEEVERCIIDKTNMEPLEDIAGYISQYCDTLVIRSDNLDHFEKLTSGASVPIISAGHAQISHPTTALNYLADIHQNLGRLHDLRVLVVAKLPKRSVMSLIEGLNKWDNSIDYIDPNTSSVKGLSEDEEVLKKYNVIFFDENQSDYESEESYFSLNYKTYKNIRESCHIIHAKPVIKLLDLDVKMNLKNNFYMQSRNSSVLKSIIFKKLINVK
ncbi:aspartate/ornithine carbamoyltransferase [Marinomonas mediterranea]|uniref:Aspartate/ornithine carbamoyltransferase carbamoyl-P binding domain n=1 Tax=Marinomonas mediterranea (strain ATCC 700492 / JCM 21426 / NBRC 103028 / MMB-1) TaxID=717774 RepID=F2K3Q7_MARM1|nr:aspartate/ornithine carbamoyltransferase [Marinomonas mediterranea]ADZ90156.1 aspartate/ornithine carbamoyltransferase carbamoyl-P binding domain [Marinomonas mediterranea MMB-1]WCN08220.1 hypothetical protein GV055_04455 [Marinomonas mediterranea]WCN12287.1 hypothetical protein GV054_04355 [Marinomonas mediterranea]WCN16358.1 hypothetical protein GV053_04455 [Marinomonas mediterranea MMB-1]